MVATTNPRRRKPRQLHPLLAEYASKAANYGQKRPEESLVYVRKFAEYMIIYIEEWEDTADIVEDAPRGNNDEDDNKSFAARLRYLQESIFTPRGIELPREKLQSMWSGGNAGAHPPKKILSEEDVAKYSAELKNRVSVTLPHVRDVRDWFERLYVEKSFVAWLLSLISPGKQSRQHFRRDFLLPFASVIVFVVGIALAVAYLLYSSRL